MIKLIIIAWLSLLGWVITADYITVVDTVIKVKAKYPENYRGAGIRLPLGFEYSRK
jgi:hypothetical protein